MTALERDAQAALARGGKLVGAFVYWKNLESFSISRDAFRAGMTAAGFADALVDDPKPEAILHKAVASARTHVEADRPFDFELKGKDDRVSYAIVRRWDDGPRIRYLEDAIVSIARDGSEATPGFQQTQLANQEGNRP